MSCNVNQLAASAAKYNQYADEQTEQVITYLLCRVASAVPQAGDGILGEQGESLAGEGGGIIFGE